MSKSGEWLKERRQIDLNHCHHELLSYIENKSANRRSSVLDLLMTMPLAQMSRFAERLFSWLQVSPTRPSESNPFQSIPIHPNPSQSVPLQSIPVHSNPFSSSSDTYFLFEVISNLTVNYHLFFICQFSMVNHASI
jgi:hypothetical protein